MRHPDELLSAFIDRELDAAQRRSVAEHLAGCADCRTELAGIEAARHAVRSLPLLDPPPGLLPAPAARRRRLPRPAWAWAATGAAAAALAIGLAAGPGIPEPDVDLDTLANRHTARVVVQPGIQTIRAPSGGG